MDVLSSFAQIWSAGIPHCWSPPCLQAQVFRFGVGLTGAVLCSALTSRGHERFSVSFSALRTVPSAAISDRTAPSACAEGNSQCAENRRFLSPLGALP